MNLLLLSHSFLWEVQRGFPAGQGWAKIVRSGPERDPKGIFCCQAILSFGRSSVGLQLARVGPKLLDLDQSRIHKESFVAKPFSSLGGPPPAGQNSGIWNLSFGSDRVDKGPGTCHRHHRVSRIAFVRISPTADRCLLVC